MIVSKLKFVDTETGGFDERFHPLVETAVADEEGAPRTLVLPHDVRQCTEGALMANRYDERGLGNRKRWASGQQIAALYAELAGTTVVCSNPSFDERFLLAFQDANPHWMPTYQRGPWLHRKIDIASYAMPLLGHERPKGLAAICQELRDLDYDVPLPDHGAANDVLALRSAYQTLERMWTR